MPIEIPERPASQVAAALPPGARLQRGQARPLTGIEVAQCLERCLLECLRQLDRAQPLQDYFRDLIRARLANENWTKVQHLTWPNVRWACRVYRSESAVWADTVVHLSEATKVVIYFGEVSSESMRAAELQQERTDTPDEIRERWGLGRLIEYVGPAGERGSITVGATDRPPVRDLPGPHVPAPVKVARKVDVGAATPSVPPPIEEPARLLDTELIGEPPDSPQVATPTPGTTGKPGVVVKEKK